MTMMSKIIAAGAGIAALSALSPAAAQYPYANRYGNAYGNNAYGMNTQAAAQRCTAAVQNQLSYSRNRTGILGALLGANTGGRVVSVTQANPQRNYVRVRGLASSGTSYGAYGVGAYGALAGAYQPDLSFKCDVDYAGNIRDIDINRRR